MEATSGSVQGRREADCAWCGALFTSVVDLIDHVQSEHLAEDPPAA